METVVQSPPVEAELHLLTDWGEIGAAERRRKAVVGHHPFPHGGSRQPWSELPESALVPREPVSEPEHLVMPLMPLTSSRRKRRTGAK